MSDKEYKGWLIVAFIISLIAGIGLMIGTIVLDVSVGTRQMPAEGRIAIVVVSSIIMYAVSLIELVQAGVVYKELKELR